MLIDLVLVVILRIIDLIRRHHPRLHTRLVESKPFAPQ